MYDELYCRAPLKWAGGKRRVLDRILPLLPKGGRFIEPFVGSAVVFLNVEHSECAISDANPDLITFYRCLRDEGEAFIEDCRPYFRAEHNRAERYYEHRDRFNASLDPRERAVLLVYLNRHGFNGLYRVNARGGFNVPFGRYAGPSLPEEAMLHFHRKACGISIEHCDFETAMERARPGDAVYCDPAYVPLSDTAWFTQYSSGGFGPAEQERLARVARETAARGATVVVSNHDTDYTREIYDGARIHAFGVQRQISCDADNRGEAPELLAVFEPGGSAAKAAPVASEAALGPGVHRTSPRRPPAGRGPRRSTSS